MGKTEETDKKRDGSKRRGIKRRNIKSVGYKLRGTEGKTEYERLKPERVMTTEWRKRRN